MAARVPNSISFSLYNFLDKCSTGLESGIRSLRNTFVSTVKSAFCLSSSSSVLYTVVPPSPIIHSFQVPHSTKPTWIVVISRSYPGSKYELKGPPNDLVLLLNSIGYLHGDKAQRFVTLTDFDVSYQDSMGLERNLPVYQATSKNIKAAIRKQSALGGRGLIIYMGHANREGHYTYFDSSDNKRIFGEDMLSWLSPCKDPNASVTILFDACYGASFLELPYVYDTAGLLPEQQVNTKDYPPLAQRQLIFISSSGSDEQTNSVESGGKRYGAFLFLAFRVFTACEPPSLSTFLTKLCNILNPDPAPSEAEKAVLKPQHPHVAALKPLDEASFFIF